MELTADLISKFFIRIKVTPNCWEWTGAKTEKNYGVLVFKGKKYLAHRISLLVCKVKIPKNKVVDHICRNALCVNPDHLRVVTTRVNSLENSNSVSAINNKKTHCIHGHEFTKENTRYYYRKNRKLPHRDCKTCNKIRLRLCRKRAKVGGLSE